MALQSFNDICSQIPHSQAYPLRLEGDIVANYITLEPEYYVGFYFKEQNKDVKMFISREENGSLKIWTKENGYQHKLISYLWAQGDIAPANADNLPMYNEYKKLYMPTIEIAD